MKPLKNIQEQAKEALPSFYEEVLMNIPADIAVYNAKGEFLFINSAVIKETTTLLQQHPPEMVIRRKEMIEEAVQTRMLQKWEERFEYPDGQVKYHIRHIQPVLDEQEQVKFCIVYSIDISEQKRAEEYIQLSEKKYRDLFNYSQGQRSFSGQYEP